MKRYKLLTSLALLTLLLALVIGCDKEKIVQSTETIHEIEYIELPPDTVTIIDTVFSYDSVNVIVTDTLMVYDTVVQIQNHYDTTIQYDTVVIPSNEANELLAMGALEFYVDPIVLEFTTRELGLSDGWIYYLSTWQSQFNRVSTGVYDIAGYIEFWATDWSGYYPLEFYYRVTHTGGDPADVTNWRLSEPSAAPGIDPGLRLIERSKISDRPAPN